MLPQPKTRCKHQPTLFEKGQKAFQRGELLKDWWPLAMKNGWNFAGEVAFLNTTAEELAEKREERDLSLSDESGYSESTQPYLW